MAKTIHIHLHSTPTRDAGNWEEGKHPRAENGQFGKGSGGGAAAKKSAPAKTPAIATRHSNRGASALAQMQAQSNAHLVATGKGHVVAGKAATRAEAEKGTRQAELREMGSPRAISRSNPMAAHVASQQPEKTPGTHQYHQAKADAMRGEHRPYGNEAGNLHISTLTHHQNAAHALKALANAQGTEHRRQLKEQADFHMGKAAEGEKRLEELGHGKRPKKTTGFGFGGEQKPTTKAAPIAGS